MHKMGKQLIRLTLLPAVLLTFRFGAPTPPSGDLVDAYVGLGVINWSMTYSLEDSLAASTNSAGDRRFDTKVSPYVMKAFDVRFKNLYGFEFGANLIIDKLSGFLDFTGSKDNSSTSDNARQLALYASRYVAPHWAIRVETKFRKFEGSATLVNAPYGASVLNAYDASGNYSALSVGSKFGWSTAMRELAIDVAFTEDKQPERFTDALWIGYFAGYRNFSYTAPAQITIDNYPASGAVSVSSLVFFDALMISEFNAHTLEAGVSILGQLRDGYGISLHLPIGLGTYGHSNPYFEMPSALIAVIPAQLNVFYAGKNWQLVLGFDLTVMMAVSSLGTTNLQRDMPYRTNAGQGTLRAGQELNVNSDRSELFWGPHLSFIYSF